MANIEADNDGAEVVELDATTCEDCGSDVYVDAAGELYDDDEGEHVHDRDCGEDEAEEEAIEIVRALLRAFVDELGDVDLSDLSAGDRRSVNALLKRARLLIDGPT